MMNDQGISSCSSILSLDKLIFLKLFLLATISKQWE